MDSESEVGWEPVPEFEMDRAQIEEDHENNPEYELHVGRVLKAAVRQAPDYRRVSIWIQGKQWTGWLSAK
jgi:hypothetical protein